MIYFLTLTFGVCLFYMFNALESQKAMLEMTSSQLEIMQLLSKMMGIVSLFVSIILSFLILYANNFLIKRRKKELGLYLTLGMEKKTISKLLMIESVIIDLLALVVGLIAGTFLSQGLSVVTAQLFAVDLKAFTFIFSSSAALKTLLYFSIIFFIVMIFNTITISKYKLIELLQADKKNEPLKLHSLLTSFLLFISSILVLGIAYTLAYKNGLQSFNMILLSAILLGVIGTYLFFFSLSGLLIIFISNCKSIYYKELNLFIIKQLSSKINSHHLSMTLICLMLFFTLGVLSTGLSMSKVLTKDLELTTPYDATLFIFDEDAPLSEQLKAHHFPLEALASNYIDFYTYETDLYHSNLFPKEIMEKHSNRYDFKNDTPLTGIKLSDFNKLLTMQGAAPITLAPDEYAISSNVESLIPDLTDILKSSPILELGDSLLSTPYQEPLIYTYETSGYATNFITLIVPDALLESYPANSTYLNINYAGDKSHTEQQLIEKLESLEQKPTRFFRPYVTKIQAYDSTLDLSTITAYIGIYIGFVFLIASAAILALQQLSEATDHVKHYELLRKIGVSHTQLNRSLLIQIALYFFAPLSLAIVHATVGIQITSKIVKAFGNINLGRSTLYTALFILLIYGTYFLATYLGAKSMITSKK